MSGTCVEKLPCTCGSSDALQVFRDNQTGEITGYCFACGTYYPDPYNKGKEKEVILDWTISDIPDRNITKESCEYFGVEVQFSEENGQIYKHRYPIYRDGKKIGHKIRVCPTKQFSTQAEGKGNMMFGEQQAKGSSGKKLFITEGELDCLSLWQVLYDYSKERYGKNMIPAVVSLRNGASSAVRELQQSASLIDRFEEIILVFDNDEAGMLAAREASKLYPDKTYIVELPEKDPSAMLVSGKGATLRQLAITARKRYKPVSLRTIEELESEVLNTQVVKGIDWPFPTLSNATFGIMRPSIYMFGAGSGCVDADTEYMSPTGWKRIADYQKGEAVLIYDAETRSAFHDIPLRYIKEREDELWHIKTKYGVDQVLCEDHNFLYEKKDSGEFCSLPMREVKKIHNTNTTGFRGRIRTTCDFVRSYGTELSDEEIRLQVAVNADGTYDKRIKKLSCSVNLKKESKKARMRKLLEEAGVSYKIHKSGDGYERFYFVPPMRKGFTPEWYESSDSQLRVITDEVLRWDGNGVNKFYTRSKQDADFIQYAFSMTGRRASLLSYRRKDGGIDYNVCVAGNSTVSFRRSGAKAPEFVPYRTKDGYKYCFTVKTGALVLRRNGNIFITGNCGKTELFKEIIIKLLRDEKLPVACFFLEEPAHKTVRVLAGKLRNKRFHLPDGSWTQEELENAVAELKSMGKLILFDSAANREWEDIKNDIRYLALGEGVRDIFLDHLTALTAAAQDERREIDKIMAELGALTEELNITIYVISHLTRSENRSKPHEEGGRVKQGDFRGSGSIQFWSHFMFGIERNTQAESEEERHTTYLRCLKDRLSGNANGLVIPLRFKPETGRLEEDELAI